MYGAVLGVPYELNAFSLKCIRPAPTPDNCSAAQELMCQGFGVNMKWQALRLPILAISTALIYSCLEQKLNGYSCPGDAGLNFYGYHIHLIK